MSLGSRGGRVLLCWKREDIEEFEDSEEQVQKKDGSDLILLMGMSIVCE